MYVVVCLQCGVWEGSGRGLFGERVVMIDLIELN